MLVLEVVVVGESPEAVGNALVPVIPADSDDVSFLAASRGEVVVLFD